MSFIHIFKIFLLILKRTVLGTIFPTYVQYVQYVQYTDE